MNRGLLYTVDTATEELEIKFESSPQEYPTTDTSCANDLVHPPDPELLRIHTAFARVLHMSGVGDYFDTVQEEAEEQDTVISADGQTDVGLLLSNRLTLTAF